MQLSAETEDALDKWLGMSTWYTGHDLDMRRWYGFVDQYSRDHGFDIDEAEIRRIVKAKLAAMGDPINDALEAILVERTHLACAILDFLRCRAERSS